MRRTAVLLMLIPGLVWTRADPEVDLEKELTIPTWSPSLNVRGSFGYKDNLALANSQQEASPFFHSDLEFFLFKFPTNGNQVTFFLEAEDYRYWEGKQVDHENYIISQAEFRHEFPSQWSVGLTADYVYQDLVTDYSTLETNSVLQIRGHGIGLRPSVKKEFPRNFWAELRVSAVRQYYAEPLGDYWEPGPRLLLGWHPLPQTEIQLSYEFLERVYDNREVVDLALTSIPGSTRRFDQHTLELRWNQQWGARKRWRSSSRLVHSNLSDNGPGFFDYELSSFRQSLEYRADKWRVKATARASYYEFGNQTVSATDPLKRSRLVWSANLRAEREISKKLKTFAEYEYERSRANRVLDEYSVNTIAGGLDWEF